MFLQVGVSEELDGDQHTGNDHCHDDCACHGTDDAFPVGAASFSRRRRRCSALRMRTQLNAHIFIRFANVQDISSNTGTTVSSNVMFLRLRADCTKHTYLKVAQFTCNYGVKNRR